jgi:hypothetical protein
MALVETGKASASMTALAIARTIVRMTVTVIVGIIATLTVTVRSATNKAVVTNSSKSAIDRSTILPLERLQKELVRATSSRSRPLPT